MTQNENETFTAAIEIAKHKYVYFTSKKELQAWLKKEYGKNYTIKAIDMILNKPHMPNVIDGMLDWSF